MCLIDRSSRDDVSLFLSVSRSNFYYRSLFALLLAVLFSRNVDLVIAQFIVRAVIKVVVVGDEVSVLELFSAHEAFVCREHLFYVNVFFGIFDPALILLLMPSVAKFVKFFVGGYI